MYISYIQNMHELTEDGGVEYNGATLGGGVRRAVRPTANEGMAFVPKVGVLVVGG